MLTRPEWAIKLGAAHGTPGALPPVLVRRVRPDDVDAVDQFIRSLSLRSRQRRFHVGIRQLSPEALARFTAPDERFECALIATVPDGAQHLCIAEARYAVEPKAPGAREFALVVADEWQRRGLGRHMLQALLVEALSQGVGMLYGDVLRENLPMLAMAESMGFTRQRHPSDPSLIRVVQVLSRGAAATPSAGTVGLTPFPAAA